ncbi:MAG: 5'/3'-nucleotidase SurE [Armatimonadetes bacterium]|nr:5'/3'-nucleotidase SurE [Armatimonadota bacterium]
MNEHGGPNILITNDDGIHAEGILALKRALDPLGNVIVVAPDRPRSASGHSITLHKPLRVNRVRLPDGSAGYSTNGTPSDCVTLGILDILEGQAALVVSGVNRGPNLGWDLTYSGTVSAAMEGAIMGVPSLAVSVASYDEHASFDYAAELSAHLAELMLRHSLPAETLLNVNVPNLPRDEISGIEVTTQGRRRYAGRIDKRTDPQGRTYYWIGGDVVPEELEPGTDGRAVADGKVSVTPVHLDLTGYGALDEVRAWGIEADDGRVGG